MTPRRVVCSLVLVASLAGCAAEPPPPPSENPVGKAVDPATAGSINGRIDLSGTPPPAVALNMGTDQACVDGSGPNPVSDAVLVSADGSLQNAFVYIKDGLDPGYVFDAPTEEVLLDQVGCVYTPRVLGVMVGQPLKVLNSDPTLHNVHALPMQNMEFNQGQPVQGMHLTHIFSVPEVMVRFMCNVHGWMAAWVGVLPHPYFGVTDANGNFELAGVPPGTYTIEAWHEVFGTQTATVTITEGQTEALSMTFSVQ